MRAQARPQGAPPRPPPPLARGLRKQVRSRRPLGSVRRLSCPRVRARSTRDLPLTRWSVGALPVQWMLPATAAVHGATSARASAAHSWTMGSASLAATQSGTRLLSGGGPAGLVRTIPGPPARHWAPNSNASLRSLANRRWTGAVGHYCRRSRKMQARPAGPMQHCYVKGLRHHVLRLARAVCRQAVRRLPRAHAQEVPKRH